MKNEPLVSVISGYYNRELLVDESIESLIKQTYHNLEIIIFDDCSTDNTYEELKKFEKDERVTIIKHEQNIGFVRGLINAIKNSRGEYIAIHGSGDYSYPERIEKQVNALLEKEEVSVVACENETFTEDGTITKVRKRYPAGNFYEDLQENTIKISGGDAMFKRSIYDKVGGHREFFKYAQDFDLWCRMSLISEYYIIPEILYRRGRSIKGSVSGSPIKRVKQIFYGGMALDSIKMRKEKGYDYVDIFGEESFIMLKNTKRISRKLSMHALKLYKNNDKNNFDIVVDILKNQKYTWRSLSVISIYYKIIPSPLMKFILFIYNKLKSIL